MHLLDKYIRYIGVLLLLGLSLPVQNLRAQEKVSTEAGITAALLNYTDSSVAEVSQTMLNLPGASPGWNTMLDAEKALKSGDYKTVLHRLMQAQARFDKDRDEVGLCMSLFKLGVLYQHWQVYERALSYYQQTEDMAKSLHMPPPFFQNLWLKQAASAQQINQLDEAITAYKKILGSYQKQSFLDGSRLILSRIADLYQQQDAFDNALTTYLELMAVERQLDNPIRLALLENSIGYTYKKLGRYQEALPYFESAISTLEKNGKHSRELVTTYVNMGSLYNQMHNYSVAINYLQKAYSEPATRKNPSISADIMNIVAVTNLNMGAYFKGMVAVDSSIATARRVHGRDILVRCYRTKALLYDNLLNFKAGSRYHQMYAELKDSIRYDERLQEQSALMRDLNVERLEKDLRLLITDTEKNQLVLRQSALEAESEIRQKEMMLLTREKEVQDYTYKSQALELERFKIKKRELEAMNALRINELERKENEIRLNQYRKKIDERNHKAQFDLMRKDKEILVQSKNQQLQKFKGQKEREKLMFGLIILSIIAIGATYAGLSRMKTANLKLRVQQDEVLQQKASVERMFNLLETKNRSITDSIKYARRIQSVIVPGPDTLSQYFPLSFVMLRPRDVVSGDVYYLHRNSRYSFLASIDCTGHGVPGAMLSVIGYQTLHNIIQAGQIIHPHAILHALDDALAQVLRIDQSDLQQGMDMGLIVIDRLDRKMFYSGAVHNLVYIKDGILNEIKASRCSIGGLVPRADKLYETTTISVTDQMFCYLASDGLPTQLGGPEGKKFGSMRLKELYLEIQSLNGNNKKAALEKAADDWIGTEQRQLDDMLVMGFRPDLAV